MGRAATVTRWQLSDLASSESESASVPRCHPATVTQPGSDSESDSASESEREVRAAGPSHPPASHAGLAAQRRPGVA